MSVTEQGASRAPPRRRIEMTPSVSWHRVRSPSESTWSRSILEPLGAGQRQSWNLLWKPAGPARGRPAKATCRGEPGKRDNREFSAATSLVSLLFGSQRDATEGRVEKGPRGRRDRGAEGTTSPGGETKQTPFFLAKTREGFWPGRWQRHTALSRGSASWSIAPKFPGSARSAGSPSRSSAPRQDFARSPQQTRTDGEPGKTQIPP